MLFRGAHLWWCGPGCCRPGGILAICFQMKCRLRSLSRRECELSVTFLCFFPSVVILHSQGCSHLSHLHWIKTHGPWVVSKISRFGISVMFTVVVTSSCVHWTVRLNRTHFQIIDIIWVFCLDIGYHYLAEPNIQSKCENFPCFLTAP